MKTNYGNLSIEMDPRTGRARMVSGGVAGNTLRTRLRDEAKTAGSSPASSPARTGGAGAKNGAGLPPESVKDAYDSKLEAARATYLGYLQLANDIKKVVHHPFSVPIAGGRDYTPDFLIEWADGRIQVEEVKGSLKQKNTRDSITRLHVAATNLPMFDWRLTMRIKGQWEEKRIPTSR